MKNFIRVTSVLALLFGSLLLVACGNKKSNNKTSQTKAQPTTTESVEAKNLAADVAAIEAQFADVEEISKDLALPTQGENGSTIVWTSSDKNVVLDNGNIAELANGGLTATGDLPTATLTAVLTNGDKTANYTLNVTVNKLSDDAKKVFRALAVIKQQYEGVQLSGYELVFEDDKDPAYTYNLYTSADVTVAYASKSENIVIEGTTAYVTRPVSEEYTVEDIEIKVTNGSVETTITMGLLITKAAFFKTIGDLITWMDSEDYVDKTVCTFAGTVIAVAQTPSGSSKFNTFYMADETAGYYIYSYNKGDNTPEVHVGDYVLVETAVTIYKGLKENESTSKLTIITPAEENTTRFNALPKTVLEDADDYNTTALKNKESSLISVPEFYYIDGKLQSGTTAYGLEFMLPDGTMVLGYVNKYVTDFSSIMSFINGLKAGDKLTLSAGTLYVSENTDKELEYSICIVNSANLTKNSEGETSAKTKFLIDKVVAKDTLELDENLLAGSYNLVTTLPNGTAVTWSVAEGCSDKVTLAVDGKSFTIAAFEGEIDNILLTATVAGIEGVEGYSLTFETNAVNPVSLADALEQAEGGTFKPNTIVKASVADVINDGTTFVLYNGEDYATAVAASGVTVTTGDVIFVASKAELANGLYNLTISKVITTENLTNEVAQTVKTVAELTNTIQKVGIRELTVADGKVTVSDTLDAEVVKYDATTKGYVAVANGTYTNVRAYVLPKDDTTLTVLVVDELDSSFKFEVATFNFKDDGEYKTGNVTVGGIPFDYSVGGGYGDGVRMRAKNCLLTNLEALVFGIKELNLVYNAAKLQYDNANAIDIKFGYTKECSDYTFTLNIEKTKTDYKITPDKADYTYVMITYHTGYNYTSYWNSMEIVLND